MHAMQYEVTLPADYDMGIIRRRVAERGAALDGLAGLGLKAYLIRERGVDASPVNEYAPFYLWNEPAAIGRFLWGGGGFAGIVESFGRPTVRHWIGAAFYPGDSLQLTPTGATRRVEHVAAHTDPAVAVAAAVDEARGIAAEPGVHCVAVAVDPSRWELVTLTLWNGSVSPADGVEVYRVLHLSRPGIDPLSRTTMPHEADS